MVDLILIATIGGTFYTGFKAGNKFRSLGELAAGARAWFKEL